MFDETYEIIKRYGEFQKYGYFQLIKDSNVLEEKEDVYKGFSGITEKITLGPPDPEAY